MVTSEPRKKRLTLISTVCLVLAFTSGVAAEKPPGTAATAAAKSWLEFADADRYAQVWEGTASDGKKLTSQAKWEKMISSQRRPLGRTVSRKLVKILPGVDGAIITFQTSFEKKKLAAEIIVLTRESDGRWRVSGYEIL